MSTLRRTQLSPQQELVRSLLEKGKTPRQIAGILNVSTQRVYQQVKRLKEKEEQDG